jgi:hypothetical protein
VKLENFSRFFSQTEPNRIKNELNIIHSDDEFCLVDRLNRAELLSKKKQKNNQKIRKSSGTVRP